MKLAAVTCVFNEADIIATTLTHLYGEGVDAVYVADGMSTDGTRDIYSQFPCKVFDQTEPFLVQPLWMERLAQQAYEDGADWVVPFDADEFWYAPSGLTIADTLKHYAVADLHWVPMYQHINYDYREPSTKPHPKVAFRARDGVVVDNGNHAAHHPSFVGSEYGLLAIREIQYRGFEHFCRKIVERNATIDPSLPYSEGTHHKQYAGWSEEGLRPVWQAMVDRATVLDPIPVRCTTA